MSEPFAFLDEEDEDDRAGIAWLPIILGGVAIAGFLSIPISGLFNFQPNETDWSKYDYQQDAVPVQLESEPLSIRQDPLSTPDPYDISDDLVSVEETLGDLGEEFEPVMETEQKSSKKRRTFLSVERQASSFVSGKVPEEKKIQSTSKRRVISHGATQSVDVAARARHPEKTVTVQKGDTLYSLARRNDSTPAEIAELNNIEPESRIVIGQTLRLPQTVAPLERHHPPNTSASPQTTPEIVRPHQPRPTTHTQAQPRILKNNSPQQSPPHSPRTVQPTTKKTQQLHPVTRPVKQSQHAPQTVAPSRPLRTESRAQPKKQDPLDKWGNVIAYRVQMFDNLNRIADAHATTPEDIIELNGRASTRKGEILVVPVDNCLLKDD